MQVHLRHIPCLVRTGCIFSCLLATMLFLLVFLVLALVLPFPLIISCQATGRVYYAMAFKISIVCVRADSTLARHNLSSGLSMPI